MNVLLIDIDSKIPNIALMKISTYHKQLGDEVTLLKLNKTFYSFKTKQSVVDNSEYDKTYVSIIFDTNKDGVVLTNNVNVDFGGSGINLTKKLPQEIECCENDYSIYDTDISYDFITRGCIRNCEFCLVNKKEGMLKFNKHPKDIIKHKKVKFLDNNFLAYNKHKEILQWLIDNKIKCQFNQGLDIRLVDDENAKMLSELNYLGDYIFAFDNLNDEVVIQSKLDIIKKYIRKRRIKFFILTTPTMSISNDVLYRVEWCRKNNCLPYIMRTKDCYFDCNKDFYTQLASWCNQPQFFLKMPFEIFVNRRLKNKEKIKCIVDIYNGD